MGQYYVIVNLDKKEMINPLNYGNGLKLTEWAFSNANTVKLFMSLMLTSWRGDRVYITGDYAAPGEDSNGNAGEVWKRAYDEAIKDLNEKNLFECSYNCENALLTEDITEKEYHYIYNHARKEYINLDNCPQEVWLADGFKPEHIYFSPLVLLLAMGNGRGGGDYRNPENMRFCGLWAETVTDIEITETPLDVDYVEFKPDFSENYLFKDN